MPELKPDPSADPMPDPMSDPIPDRADERHRMVETQIARRGIRNARLLAAMQAVPREAFVSATQAPHAYADGPLPIGEGQTISQPYVVALMIEAAELRPGDRVLEIGAGSGYAAAVMSRLSAAVHAIERLPALAAAAGARLAALGCGNVAVAAGDGTLGWPEAAPYDAIIVSAGGPSVPPALVEQLKPGGRLVIPVGGQVRGQRLLRLRRTDDGTEREDLGAVSFVPLIGAGGWQPEAAPPAPPEDE